MPRPLDIIQHIVVVMLENRSFDNLLGFLYADQGNRPPRNLPVADPPTFDGLLAPGASDAFWNPANPGFFTNGEAPDKVFASFPTTGLSPLFVPDPDPNEGFADITFQLFGNTSPGENQIPGMAGFLVNYLKAKGVTADMAAQIMES